MPVMPPINAPVSAPRWVFSPGSTVQAVVAIIDRPAKASTSLFRLLIFIASICDTAAL
jgi:hypothetical protein